MMKMAHGGDGDAALTGGFEGRDAFACFYFSNEFL